MTLREELQNFVRRFGLLNASCCESCCGEKVSLVQSQSLSAIRRMENPSIQQVATELGIDITTFSRQVKRLESKGLIARQPSSEDRRVSLLKLTPEGMRVLEQIDRFMGRRIERMLSTMTPFERDVVVRSLHVLNQALILSGSCDSGADSCITQVQRGKRKVSCR